MAWMKKSWFFCTLFALTSSVPIFDRSDKCDHPNKYTSFPPKVFHQVLDSTFIDSFEEVLVIGDVHGCLEELKLLLKKSNSSNDNVLKILAGDFLRKGPYNVEVLRFIKDTPTLLTVRGNNDQKVLIRHHKANDPQSNYQLKKSDMFIKNMTSEDFEFLSDVPYTISIPSLNAIIVHGGVRPGVPLEYNQPYDLMNLRNFLRDEKCVGGLRPLLNKDTDGFAWAPEWPGPEQIYFGHDHPRNFQLTPHAIGLDTSCVYGRYLTGLFIKGPREGTYITQNALEQYFSH